MKNRALLRLFALTILLSAALLFLVQLIFARLALPLLGGAPAVWNTAMVFYQAVLLAGYAYAHFVATRARMRTQLAIHAVVLMAPLATLPFHVPAGWVPPAEASPVLWLLLVLSVSVGLPFFAVSTTSPLLQKWFASTDHASASDPYFLYASSNAGSLIGLLGYPFLIEPNTALRDQAIGWAVGFVTLGVSCLAAGALSLGNARAPRASSRGPEEAAPTGSRRLRWALLAAVPSSLMLSVTTYVSTDIAAIPLLWVIPLALYLVTFILVFARRTLIPHELAQRALPLLLVPVVLVVATGATSPLFLLMGLHILTFFVATLVCHGELARDRPASTHLTEFYLWMSVGGVLGGAFNALVAPVLFDGVYEYDLVIAAAAYLGAPAGEGVKPARALDVALPVLVGTFAWALASLVPRGDERSASSLTMLAFGVPSVLCFMMSRHRLRFALAVAAVLAVGRFAPALQGSTLETERSFFGVHRVTQDEELVQLVHGKTIHGMQSTDPEARRAPLSYYHREGPLGQLFETWGRTKSGPIGAVGLGAGAVAAYGKPGQELAFFEIDPVVKRIASDRRFFTYLSDSLARVSIVLGDARLSLGEAPDAYFELLILDAYSSDSVPVHLITREAFALYARKLRADGVMAFHISNLHTNLRPVVANLARDAGFSCWVRADSLGDAEIRRTHRAPSQWAVVARKDVNLSSLITAGPWRAEPGDATVRVWTDDYSSLVSVLDLGMD
ncbi:MAG: fused MFS/spermidine synthase [Deltaproteobacteria bacterium]|nr:fused MFS/spermidine synthase [Deltaproteobacteria bacterium]